MRAATLDPVQALHYDETATANVAHFMCELITDATAWGEWRGRLPVIVNAGSKRRSRADV